ncbi:TonB family protein [Mucilaginibacter sp. BT774]|uniref:TonB family protein n=1 Tax=Mucilaginibacter sp. BT774 TaxID=3062276 RepID=UPI002676F0C8|nr:TonB family protein [Mucilaginibacter sp. BT774]MDO3626627.1 TonB family protein [Mucilaginibacter sp. BT774]
MDRADDIIQIRKYLNGELNTRAMHELERRALDDPFLADAMEGFEQTPGNQKASLTELANRLHQRTEKKTRKIIPWIPLSAAASIIVILGAGIWFFINRNGQSEAKRVVAQNLAPEKKETPAASNATITADTLRTEENKAITQTQAKKVIADKEVEAKSNATMQADEVELKEAPPVTSDLSVAKAKAAPATAEPSPNADKGYEYGYLSPKKDSLGANDILVGDISKKKAGNASAFKPKSLPPTPTLLQSRAEGVRVNPNDNYTVTGTVVGDGGLPLTGATVKVQGRNFGAVTDANGRFTLQDVPKGQTISVNYIGYSGKKVKADQDSMRISLDPTGSALAEVVVVKEAENNSLAQEAHPRDGWKSFNDYLEKNGQLSDGKSGKVKVSFTVASDGTLSQFKVVKSLGDDADKKAISLISTGPPWAGNADGKPKEVTVTVKFH